MAGELTSTLGNFYQTHYRDVLNSDVPRASKVANMLFNLARVIELGGTSLNTTWAHQTAEGVGYGALTESGDYPDAGFDSAENPTLTMTHFAASVKWSGHAIAAGNKSRYDRNRLIRKKTKALTDQLKKYMARWFMWDGSSEILCQATNSTAAAPGYFEIKAGGCPIGFFEPGQVVTARDTASSGTEQLTNAATGAGRVTGVDPDLGRVYLKDTTGLSDDDSITWANCYDASVPNGLRSLVSASGTVQGIDRSLEANSFWRSIEVTDATALSSTGVDELRDRVMDQADLRIDGGYTSAWIGNRKTRRWATLATIGQNRFADLDLTMGVAQMRINDKDGRKVFVEDEYIIDAELFCVVWEKFVIGYPEGERGGMPVMNGSSPLFQATAASGDGYSDSQLAYAVWRGNIGIDDARCQGKKTSFISP